jgi:hypothetical protein
MKRLNCLLLFLLFASSFAYVNAQTIEGQSASKYISLKQKADVALPVITWKYPATEHYSTDSKTHNLEVCIVSKEKPSNIVLYVDRVRQDSRDFFIQPVNNGCDYTWKVSMTFGNVGKYFLELEATNSAGKASESRILEIKDGNMPNPSPAVTGKKLALVIGNGAYEQKPLPNPTNDANDMAIKLKALGFTVYKHTDLNQRATNDAVSNFTDKINKGDIALFFYAGHGYQINGVSYLLPIGAMDKIKSETDAEYEGYPIDRILGNMQSAGANTNLVFLDACRDNPVRSVFRSAAGGRGLAFPKETPSGFLISFATAGGSTASDGTGRNGTYTAALLKFLEPNNSINDILTMVNREVKINTNELQMPEFKSSLDNIFKF